MSSCVGASFDVLEAQCAPSSQGSRSFFRTNSPLGGVMNSARRFQRSLSRQQNDVPNYEPDCVEVVLDQSHGPDKVIVEASPERRGDNNRQHGSSQNVFRGPPPPPPGPPPPHSAVHPRSMRTPRTTSGPSTSRGSSSYGYGSPPSQQQGSAYDHPPGSFEVGHQAPQQQHHYSPQLNYPTYGYPSYQVNVISPSHRGDHPQDDRHSARPPMPPQTSHRQQGYHYPPTSPVRTSRKAQQGQQGESSQSQHPDDGTFNSYTPEIQQPPVVAESSFDSEQYPHSHYSSQHPNNSHPPTPQNSHYSPNLGPTSHPTTPQVLSTHVSPHGSHAGSYHSPQAPTPGDNTQQQQFYDAGDNWQSFESPAGKNPAPPHFDDNRYYGNHQDSPYSNYQSPGGQPHGEYSHPQPYSHDCYQQHPSSHGDGRFSDQHQDVHSDFVGQDQDGDDGNCDDQEKSAVVLPKAAAEIDFELTKPPMTPVTPPGTVSVCESLSVVNLNDVICGRGGGTNSQVGNRRFRRLVQEFQPTYLLARRKEKPLLARTIVLIIRKRGGRFLKKDDKSGNLFEVGDPKSEAKTSQALREGLDVRATKTSTVPDKQKKNKKGGEDEENDYDSKESPLSNHAIKMCPSTDSLANNSLKEEEDACPPSPPPSLPGLGITDKLNMAGLMHPHSPDALNFRKRRRMRSKEGATLAGCGDKLFMDFCPPKADLHRSTSPHTDDSDDVELNAPRHRDYKKERYQENDPQPGCANIALMAITGAAAGGFCLGPSRWGRS